MSSERKSDPSELGTLLRHASVPTELSPERNAELVARAFDAAFASTRVEDEPTASELEAAEALRQALETGGKHALLEVVQLLRATVPSDNAKVDEFTDRRLVAAALREHPSFMRSRAPLLVTGLAAAAALFLLFQNGATSHTPSFGNLRVQTSTQTLLSGPLAPEATSARMDRVAELRTQDLRNNRYAQWGIK